MECQYCRNSDSEDLLIDEYDIGFWCEECDGYTHLSANTKHKFEIILEDRKKGKEIKVIKKNLRKQISPIRYPGGKSKLIDFLVSKLNLENLSTFVEPYVGGGSVGLSLLIGGLTEKLIINDIDYGIYSLFKTMKKRPYQLIRKIENADLNHCNFFDHQSLVLSKYPNLSEMEAAWSFLVVNRLSYSGIVKANTLGGRNGSRSDLLSRFNKRTLVNRIKLIHSIANKIEIYNLDALEVIQESYWMDNATIFIDPPYVLKGKDIYNHYYEYSDHIELSKLIQSLHFQCNGADMIVTYDNDKLIHDIYSLGDIEEIKRIYSI